MIFILMAVLLLCAVNYITQERLHYKKTIFYMALLIQILGYWERFRPIGGDWSEKWIPGIAIVGIYLVLMCNIFENIRQPK